MEKYIEMLQKIKDSVYIERLSSESTSLELDGNCE